MSATSAIEWTDATWNPVTGCTKVSPGCDHCYAETFSERFRGTSGHHFERGFDLQLRPERLEIPLRWREPRRVFVNSMSDLFHDGVPVEFIARVFAVMAAAPDHTFQVLTKRHGRMRSLLSRGSLFPDMVDQAMAEFTHAGLDAWPLPNVWLGVSVEDQQRADLRIPALLDTPAAVRWISAEPLLGPVELHRYVRVGWGEGARHSNRGPDGLPLGLDWVVAGGESGAGARPMDPAWVRSLRDQCEQARVPFLFKQWGEWAPTGYVVLRRGQDPHEPRLLLIGEPIDKAGHRRQVQRVGKKRAGRELDGRTWDQYPVADRAERYGGGA